jgi:hypothetical protein
MSQNQPKLLATEPYSVVYFADNIVEAKSIAVGERKDNIYVSLDNYKDLSDLSWTIKQKPPEMVVVTTDNFLQKSEQVLTAGSRIICPAAAIRLP